MDLRKICNHPFLVPGVEPPGDTLGEDLVGSSGKLALLDRMLVQLKARGHKVREYDFSCLGERDQQIWLLARPSGGVSLLCEIRILGTKYSQLIKSLNCRR